MGWYGGSCETLSTHSQSSATTCRQGGAAAPSPAAPPAAAEQQAHRPSTCSRALIRDCRESTTCTGCACQRSPGAQNPFLAARRPRRLLARLPILRLAVVPPGGGCSGGSPRAALCPGAGAALVGGGSPAPTESAAAAAAARAGSAVRPDERLMSAASGLHLRIHTNRHYGQTKVSWRSADRMRARSL